MGIFAETAKVNYRLSFADQGKQTSLFRFPFVENKHTSMLSVCSKQTKVAVFF
jgi:hypothetical protein